MDVRFVTTEGIEDHQVKDLKALLERDDGFTWVDIPECDAEATQVLSEVFGFHPLAVKACGERNHIPRIHAYTDHVFAVLRRRLRARARHGRAGADARRHDRRAGAAHPRSGAQDPERILHELFQVRHELLTVRTMAGQSRRSTGG
jgi:Mg2+ and Co2+ transporter CorA